MAATTQLQTISAAEPYNYSDMTGHVLLGSTFSSGSWTFVHDGGGLEKIWTTLSWTKTTPTGTMAAVEVRAVAKVTELPGTIGTPRLFQTANSAQALNGVTGRFLEVRVTLSRNALVTAIPSLSALSVACPN